MYVRFIDKVDHERFPEFYPKVGTVGKVIFVDAGGHVWVKWPDGSTSRNDEWCCDRTDLEPILESEEDSNGQN